MTQKNAVDQAKPVLSKVVYEERPQMTYAQQKEVSIIIHWLNFKGGPWVPRNALVERLGVSKKDPVLPFSAVISVSQQKISDKLKPMEAEKKMSSDQRRRVAEIIQQLKGLIAARVDSFQYG